MKTLKQLNAEHKKISKRYFEIDKIIDAGGYSDSEWQVLVEEQDKLYVEMSKLSQLIEDQEK